MFATSTRVSRLSAFAFALVMAASLHAGLLSSFNQVAHEGAWACRASAAPVVALESVTVTHRRA